VAADCRPHLPAVFAHSDVDHVANHRYARGLQIQNKRIPVPSMTALAPRWATQSLYDALVSLTTGAPQSFGRRFARRILVRLRRHLVHLTGDKLVRARFLDHEIIFPLSHNLILYQKEQPSYSQNLARVSRIVFEKYPSLKAIDIGGNIGDSVLLMRQAGKFPVLTVEGDPRFLACLEANLASEEDVTIERSFIGSDGDAKTLVPKDGTSQLVSTDGGGSSVTLKSFTRTIEEHQRFATAKLLKIDTDGFDFLILTSARDWLPFARPAIFFEYDRKLAVGNGPSGIETLQSLAKVGYSSALVWDNNGRFVLASSPSDLDLFEDIDGYIGDGAVLYWDICLFHDDDRDLAERLRRVEHREQQTNGKAP
jgi:FkbM family methyltransferase